jgi:hypothetical protein
MESSHALRSGSGKILVLKYGFSTTVGCNVRNQRKGGRSSELCGASKMTPDRAILLVLRI